MEPDAGVAQDARLGSVTAPVAPAGDDVAQLWDTERAEPHGPTA